ncbi:MAG: dihydrofolate reductase [Candidatus Vogelbacteria bacterium]|nr:dihydrofolate reductase [Candidatus Vogelbacteria bacterium]
MNQPRLSIIAAIGEKTRAIGKNNQLLWHLPEDLKHFKMITSGHPIIMGLNTFKSIGRPLPNRINIVLNFQPVDIPGAIVCSSLEEAIRIAGEHDQQEIFIIGGGMVYKSAIDLADRLYLTLVNDNADGDTYFPDYSNFTKVVSETSEQGGSINFRFIILEKN